jgi:hypothetical protein
MSEVATTTAAKSELIERVFGSISTDTLPAALGAALLELARLAAEMHPDDIALSLDLPAGTLSFRAYRRAEHPR